MALARAEPEEGTQEYDLVWWLVCPVCGMAWHVADLNFEMVRTGEKIHHTCHQCGTKIVMTVEWDTGVLDIEAIIDEIAQQEGPWSSDSRETLGMCSTSSGGTSAEHLEQKQAVTHTS